MYSCTQPERIVNRIKVNIERNNMQVELLGFSKKNIYFTHVYFCESRNSMQYRSQNPILDGCSVYCHLTDTSDGLTSFRCDFGHLGSLSLVTQLRY